MFEGFDTLNAASGVGSLASAMMGAYEKAQARKAAARQAAMEEEMYSAKLAREQGEAAKAQWESSPSLGVTDAALKLPTAGLPEAGQIGPSAPKAVPNKLALEYLDKAMQRQAQGAEKRLDFKAKPSDLMSIKKDFDNVSNSYVLSRDGWNKVQQAASNPSPVGDIGLIFGYMKTIDPTSTVREGEFATASNAGGVPERITNLYNRVKNGERLTQEQRQDFAEQAYRAYKTYENSYKLVKQQTEGIARYSGIDPKLVVTPYEQTAEPPLLPAGQQAQPDPLDRFMLPRR